MLCCPEHTSRTEELHHLPGCGDTARGIALIPLSSPALFPGRRAPLRRQQSHPLSKQTGPGSRWRTPWCRGQSRQAHRGRSEQRRPARRRDQRAPPRAILSALVFSDVVCQSGAATAGRGEERRKGLRMDGTREERKRERRMGRAASCSDRFLARVRVSARPSRGAAARPVEPGRGAGDTTLGARGWRGAGGGYRVWAQPPPPF